MPTRYTVTVVAPGASPTLAVPFEPSALVSSFITELWKRISKVGFSVQPNTHIATLHLDSETGAIIDTEDILEDVVNPENETLFATFKQKVDAAADAAPVSEPHQIEGQALAVRVITPALALQDRNNIKPIRISPFASIKQLHEAVARHLGLQESFGEPQLEHECNCTLAKKLADGAPTPSKLTVVHGKSAVQYLDIPESSTELIVNSKLKNVFGENVTSKKLSFYGAEHHPSAFSIENGARTYKKPPVVAICSKQRHVPTHARMQYDEEDNDMQLRRTLDLHTDELPISRACFGATLADAGFKNIAEDGVLDIYAVNRALTGSRLNGYLGGHKFRYRAHWEPETRQSHRGMAIFLSSLFVATAMAQDMSEREQDAIYHALDLLLRFPPALRALHILIEGKTPTAVESAALSLSLYEVLDSFMPTQIIGSDHTRVFEGTRLMFGFVFEQARFLKLSEDAADQESLPYLSSFKTIDVRDHKTQEPVIFALATQSGLVEKSLFDAFSDVGVLRDSHIQSFLVEIETDPATKRVALLNGGIAGEVVVFSRRQLANNYLYPDGGDADAVFDISEMSELHQMADLCGRNSLGAHKPRQLVSAINPCLVALDRNGHLAVYTGQLACSAPGQSTEIFRPKHGEETINESTLEQIIEPIVAGYEADGTAVFDVHGGAEVKRASAPDEIVMFAVDCSRSMSRPADFDELQDNEDDWSVAQIGAESVVDRQFYARASFDDVTEELSKHESFDDMIAIVADAGSVRERSVARDVLSLMQAQVGREIMQNHARLEAQQASRLAYYVLPELRSSLEKLMVFWAGTKTHEEALCDFLIFRANAAHGVGRSWMWSPGDEIPSGSRHVLPSLSEDITDVSRDLLCPVSHSLMEDAVKATDGFTYSQQGIAQWFAVRLLSSPMHGLPLSDTTLEPNEKISRAVSQWIGGQGLVVGSDAVRARGSAVAITLTFSSRIGQFQRKVSLLMTIRELYQLVFRGLKARYLVFELARGSDTLRPSPQTLISKGFRNSDEVVVRLADDDSMAVSGSGTTSSSSEEHALIKVYHSHKQVLCSYWMPRTTTKTMGSILWKFWRAYFNKFSRLRSEEQVVWTGLHSAGDGFGSGDPCEDPKQQLSRFLTPMHCFGKLTDEDVYHEEDEAMDLRQPDQPLVLKVKVNDRRSDKGRESTRLSRLDVLKQMFDALINRMIAYQFSTHVGLVTFESTCRVHMAPSPTLENFRRATNSMEAEGNTKLWGGLALAKDQLLEYAKKYPNARKRIIVLSDGVDTDSEFSSYDTAWAMFQSGIVTDSISLGGEENVDLKTVSHIPGCYRFHPTSLANALAICEMEPFLSVTHRPSITATRGLPRNRPQFISHFKYSRWRTTNTVVTADDFPAGKVHPNLYDEVVELTAASSAPSSSAQTDGRRSNKRIPRLMNEMKRIVGAGSHPKYDIYVSTADISFWRIVMQGPDESPYSAGTFMLYMSAGADYPYQPPEVRFVSKIMHPNISAHGRVCHSLLTGRDWTSDTSMTTVLDTVFGLLLQAETSDPVNVMTTLGYHHDQVEFADEVRAHVQRHAKKTRQQWKKELTETEEENDENELKEDGGEEDEDDEMEGVDSDFGPDDVSDGHFEEDGMTF